MLSLVPEERLSGFRLVYQGGHHDVWCDGKTHVQTNGGIVHDTPKKRFQTFPNYKCNCDKYRKD